MIEPRIKQPQKIVRISEAPPTRLDTHKHLTALAGITPMEQRPIINIPPQLRPPPVEKPFRPTVRETRGIFEKAPPIKPVSIKNAEALIMQTTDAKTREPIPKEEFKTLHPSEHFFSKIPKLKEVPHTNEQIAGSVPDSRIVAEKNLATPYEIYKQEDFRGPKFVIRKIHPDSFPVKLIKEDGEAQEVKADNGRDVVKTLAFQITESGKNKFFRLEETKELTMRFVEITDKKQIAKVIVKKQEYARKNGYLPDRNKLRQNPGMEIHADQKKQDHFYTWHNMLDRISMQSIQTLGKAHIICDKSLPPEKASLFSKKFIEAYYSEKKYEGLSIEERTKQIFADILKELGLEDELSVATYLVTHENTAYMGGIGTAKITASYGDSLDETEPPNVFQTEKITFKNNIFAIDGRELVFVDDATPPVTGETPEVSPDNNGVRIQLKIHPDEE